MPLFKKRDAPIETQDAPAEQGSIPTDIVMQMRQQGYSNNQIIQYLTDQGYSSSQIFDAMSQADIRKIAGPEASVPESPAEAPEPMPREYPSEIPQQQYMEPPEARMPQMQPMPAYAPPAPTITKEEVEEIAESIIEEKWTDLMKSLEKVIAWKDSTEVKLTKLGEEIIDLKERFEALHKGVLERVSEYDKGIRQVGVNVKAMEEVFKKLLPQFTENVSELSKITKKVKS